MNICFYLFLKVCANNIIDVFCLDMKTVFKANNIGITLFML